MGNPDPLDELAHVDVSVSLQVVSCGAMLLDFSSLEIDEYVSESGTPQLEPACCCR